MLPKLYLTSSVCLILLSFDTYHILSVQALCFPSVTRQILANPFSRFHPKPVSVMTGVVGVSVRIRQGRAQVNTGCVLIVSVLNF